jgi:hypothetical protein
MREWIDNSFTKYIMIDRSKKIKLLAELDKEKFPYDFDLIVKVVQIFHLNENFSDVRFLDESNQIWFARISNLKFIWIREGQLVKIKSASLFNCDPLSRTLSLPFASNILTIPPSSLLSTSFLLDTFPSSIDADI